MDTHRRYIRVSLIAAVVWAVVLVLGAIIDRQVTFSGTTFVVLLLVFGGFVIGWAGGTMAHSHGDATARR